MDVKRSCQTGVTERDEMSMRLQRKSLQQKKFEGNMTMNAIMDLWESLTKVSDLQFSS
jgi:hypothetical protein